jgi:hypothetical protein
MVIFHIGATITGGHYTAAVKSPSGQWVMTDDKSVPVTWTLDESMIASRRKRECLHTCVSATGIPEQFS